jgi:membrane-bound lytic murein transglycosylase D
MRRALLAAWLCSAALPALAAAALPGAPAPAQAAIETPATPQHTRRGLDIYARFHEGLADPVCGKDSSSARWRAHFAAAPERLGRGNDDALALFGYVVDALREASLPTEYALIPFVESGYKPGARSRGGPAGMWQMIRITARKHQVPMQPGYDGRLSPVDSTRAAVRYLKTLHGMFAGDWRLAVMAYNAGEYRVFGALRRSGQVARSADPEKLASLSGITRAYVRKLHALSCLLDHADEREQWLQSLDREVPVLEAVVLPPDARSLDAWARATGRDAAAVRRLNPAFAGGVVVRSSHAQHVLAPMRPVPALAMQATGAAPVAAGPERTAQAH